MNLENQLLGTLKRYHAILKAIEKGSERKLVRILNENKRDKEKMKEMEEYVEKKLRKYARAKREKIREVRKAFLRVKKMYKAIIDPDMEELSDLKVYIFPADALLPNGLARNADKFKMDGRKKWVLVSDKKSGKELIEMLAHEFFHQLSVYLIYPEKFRENRKYKEGFATFFGYIVKNAYKHFNDLRKKREKNNVLIYAIIQTKKELEEKYRKYKRKRERNEKNRKIFETYIEPAFKIAEYACELLNEKKDAVRVLKDLYYMSFSPEMLPENLRNYFGIKIKEETYSPTPS